MENNERCKAVINLKTLVENFLAFQELVGSQTRVAAVVKANAYGHGAKEVSLSLEEHGCNFFVVASLEEAIELREFGVKSDILVLGYTNIELAFLLNKYNLTQTVTSYEYACDLNKMARQKTKIHIKIDTGLSRFGFYMHEEEDVPDVLNEIITISRFSNLLIDGIYTHFADSDNSDDTFIKKQFIVFSTLLRRIKFDGLEVRLKHCGNTSITLRFPEMRLDMVRVGIGLYGYPQVVTDLPLHPVMELLVQTVDLRKIKTDDTVSYGRKFTAHSPMSIATFAIGYADGYPRGLTNTDYFLFQGKKIPITGTICMDACMGDVTNLDISRGDYVTVFGEGKTVKVIAKNLKTIDYEILTGIGQRVKRIYIR